VSVEPSHPRFFFSYFHLTDFFIFFFSTTTNHHFASFQPATDETGNPKECKYAPRSNPAANLATAFTTAEQVYGLSAMMDPNDPYATQCEQVSIIYMASLYLALPSEFDLLTTRVFIYIRVMRWWRRIQPAVHLRKVRLPS
jgi:hypothetical protein